MHIDYVLEKKYTTLWDEVDLETISGDTIPQCDAQAMETFLKFPSDVQAVLYSTPTEIETGMALDTIIAKSGEYRIVRLFADDVEIIPDYEGGL